MEVYVLTVSHYGGSGVSQGSDPPLLFSTREKAEAALLKKYPRAERSEPVRGDLAGTARFYVPPAPEWNPGPYSCAGIRPQMVN